VSKVFKEATGSFNTTFPAWFRENLDKLSKKLGEPINKILMDAAIEKHPQLKNAAAVNFQNLFDHS
jgi:hypothetical protein